jgi:aquaporin Z
MYMDKTLAKQLVAEFLGTATLTFVVLSSVSNPSYPIPTPALAALTLGVFVATIGKISGCHINPAVTLALASVKQIDWQKAGLYIIMQIIGAFIARTLLVVLSPSTIMIPATNTPATFIFEMLGTFIFVFGIASVVFKKVNENLAAPIIGFSLLLGISVAALGANAILNPAVALGLGSLNLVYALAPLVGAVAAVNAYKWIAK